jgi:hypothetical protein
MGDDSIDIVINHIDMGYLVTLWQGLPAMGYLVTESRSSTRTAAQGLTLVPNSAQLELFCPPYNPT